MLRPDTPVTLQIEGLQHKPGDLGITVEMPPALTALAGVNNITAVIWFTRRGETAIHSEYGLPFTLVPDMHLRPTTLPLRSYLKVNHPERY